MVRIATIEENPYPLLPTEVRRIISYTVSQRYSYSNCAAIVLAEIEHILHTYGQRPCSAINRLAIRAVAWTIAQKDPRLQPDHEGYVEIEMSDPSRGSYRVKSHRTTRLIQHNRDPYIEAGKFQHAQNYRRIYNALPFWCWARLSTEMVLVLNELARKAGFDPCKYRLIAAEPRALPEEIIRSRMGCPVVNFQLDHEDNIWQIIVPCRGSLLRNRELLFQHVSRRAFPIHIWEEDGNLFGMFICLSRADMPMTKVKRIKSCGSQ